MIAALVQRPEIASEARPGHRFALIDHPFAPLDANPAAAGVQAQLKQDLANIVSAEALFVLTDLCGLSPHDAIDSVIHAARSVKNQSLDRDTWKVGHWQQFWTGANATSCAWHGARHVTVDTSGHEPDLSPLALQPA